MYDPILIALQTLFSQPANEPRRIFHGRGHRFEGLEHINLDWYPPVVLITGYKPIENLDGLVDLIVTEDVKDQIKSIVCQKRSSKGASSKNLWGPEMPEIVVVENGLKYEVHPGVRQNAGLFLDMRPLRCWLKDNSREKSVLNLFAYTCSLSVAALAGQARQVVNVDMSKPSINWGLRNHKLNDQDMRAVRTIPHKLFKSWARVQKLGPYDTILIDPPSRQRGSFDVEKDYSTLLKKLSRFCNTGTDIFTTLNSPYLNSDYLPNLMQRYQPKCRLIGEFAASPEFSDRFPERGLKIHHFRYH